jgi:hypothetical protein
VDFAYSETSLFNCSAHAELAEFEAILIRRNHKDAQEEKTGKRRRYTPEEGEAKMSLEIREQAERELIPYRHCPFSGYVFQVHENQLHYRLVFPKKLAVFDDFFNRVLDPFNRLGRIYRLPDFRGKLEKRNNLCPAVPPGLGNHRIFGIPDPARRTPPRRKPLIRLMVKDIFFSSPRFPPSGLCAGQIVASCEL